MSTEQNPYACTVDMGEHEYSGSILDSDWIIIVPMIVAAILVLPAILMALAHYHGTLLLAQLAGVTATEASKARLAIMSCCAGVLFQAAFLVSWIVCLCCLITIAELLWH